MSKYDELKLWRDSPMRDDADLLRRTLRNEMVNPLAALKMYATLLNKVNQAKDSDGYQEQSVKYAGYIAGIADDLSEILDALTLEKG
jgi:hypothetical protein